MLLFLKQDVSTLAGVYILKSTLTSNCLIATAPTYAHDERDCSHRHLNKKQLRDWDESD